MPQALYLERGLIPDFPDGLHHLFNAARDRRVSLSQITSRFLGRQRSVTLSSLVGSDALGDPVWARIISLMISEDDEYLTIGVPDDRDGYVYTSYRYDTNDMRGGEVGGLAFGIGIDVHPMKARMIANGHYALNQLPASIDFAETVRRFLKQIKEGDYDSIPPLVPPSEIR